MNAQPLQQGKITIERYFSTSYGLPVSQTYRFNSTETGKHGNSDASDVLPHSAKLTCLSMLHEAEAALMRDDRDRATNLVENVANIIRPRQ